MSRLKNNNLILSIIILLAFIGIGVFGLFPATHSSHEAGIPMVDCPYTDNGYSVCENTLDHVSKWQQLSTATHSSFWQTLFLFLALALLLIYDSLLNAGQSFFRRFEEKISHFFRSKIIKWLSLFENSPSFKLQA